MKINKWLIMIILLSVIGTMFLYPSLPDKVPGHWNIKGEIDRYQSREFSILTALLPLILYLFMVFLPKIDPKKASYKKHEKAYRMVQVATVVFMIVLHWITMAVAMGYKVDVVKIIELGLGTMFIIIGNYMSQIRHNYFFGIKNPWTLANEEVWKKTHRVGGYSFVLSGLIAFVSAFLPNSIAFPVMMTGIFIPLIATNIYSYLLYKKIVKE